MSETLLVIGNRKYASWLPRAWLALGGAGAELRLRLGEFIRRLALARHGA